MASRSTESFEQWISHAEAALYALAHDLRRIPLEDRTRRLHVRALELKREVARARARLPDLRTRHAVLAEIERLALDVRRNLEPCVDRSRSPSA